MPEEIVKYIPFQSTADPSFWMKLGDHKLNTIKLSEDNIAIKASYTIQSNVNHRTDNTVVMAGLVPGRMRLDEDSIMEQLHENENYYDAAITGNRNDLVVSKGRIKILNTIESFKNVNKNELLNQSCLPALLKACGISNEEEGDDINAGSEQQQQEEDLDALVSFFCLCHLDLKSHKVVYWFAFPVLAPAAGKSVRFQEMEDGTHSQLPLKEAMGEGLLLSFHSAVHDLRLERFAKGLGYPPFFIVTMDTEGAYKCLDLSYANYMDLAQGDKDRCMFAFLDPTSSSENIMSGPIPVGWTLRNLVAYLVLKLGLSGAIQVIAFRPNVNRRVEIDSTFSPDESANNDSSLLMHVQLPSKLDYLWPVKNNNNPNEIQKTYNVMGWELNARSKAGPRSVNLAPLLSTAHLAKQATDLNLKLMKWRMIPTLDLEYLSNMRVLLLGAGTLGCSVARTLLGWGVRNMTFVDNGKVSYSNPVRQNLFEVQDCERGGKDKAIAAADALKRIAGPSINSEGHVLTIPMPGHPFSDKEEESVRQDTEKMQALIDDADVVFLLTDTRESRWLPTVMARASNKMLINAALGLDSWLVMRHGGNKDGRLGCYFCNDVVAPENSTNNRTLDQQCTVTRPGLAPLASSMAVELCISLLHHKERQDAPAPLNKKGPSAFSPTFEASDATSPLGIMPHQIRGSIVSYTMMTPTVPAFHHCTGCCDDIIEVYKKERFDFVKKVCCDASGSYLEDIAGLTKFRAEANSMIDDCLDWDEDDDVDVDDLNN
mmetsp:Transcript_8691/g.13117  ORF Transcript_8691/g.13117 Transcript_8691/m.13117 type:complete len:769 (+) Transcript_8691:139-2445(+)